MKRNLKAAAVVIALVMMLTACSNNKNNSNNTFDRSAGLDENGYWKGITASEYVKMPDLSTITVKQSEIDSQINSFIYSYPDTKEIYDRAVKDGDTINIDFVGKLNGVEFEGGSTQGQGTTVTIGYDTFVDNMLERMVGHMPGEIFDLDAKFPETYSNAELAGKDTVFTITIHYIVEDVYSEWTNEFVYGKLNEQYGWSTTEEAELGIKTALAEDALYDQTEFLKDTPEHLIQYQIDSMIAYYEQMATVYGMDLSTLVTYMGYETIDDLKDSYKQSAEQTAKFYLIYQAIAESKGYKVTKDELKAYFKEMTGSEDYSTYEDNFGLPYLKAMVMYEKMSKSIEESATITK